MASILYLPRLFVYHISSDVNSIQSETFKIMERRLTKVIMNPSMVIVFLTGVSLIYLNKNLLSELYFQIKILLVFFMGFVHGKFIGMAKKFENDRRYRTDVYYRVWNEVPTCLMILIVILVVVKPF